MEKMAAASALQVPNSSKMASSVTMGPAVTLRSIDVKLNPLGIME